MRKNKLLTGIVIAMAVMAATTACGSKDNKKTDTTKDTDTKVSMAETTVADTETSESDEADNESDEANESSQSEQKTSSDAGKIASGVFTSVSGKYEITPPAGWTLDNDGDESVVAFTSPDGNDVLEVTYAAGEEADGAREEYPDTKEEYKKLINRGEDMEFVRYNVKNGADGSQTFRYAIRYKTPDDGVRYFAISGSYDATAKTYLSATGTIESSDTGVEDQIEAALDTLKLK
ncbi:hypothetical protein [Clostridium sp. E02]|uniref:hypothetical protein n=1 Tax=Clostridium sp. E02 TaxID=2487134 RepID=UPI000F54C1D2|nr:hypothetical protein [Clostridium sp. E02]